MKKKLINFVKYFKWAYAVYFYMFGFFLSILKVFLKTDDNLILFNSFGGKKYDDSPKEIYEAMLKDERFKGYKFVWAFHEPKKFNVPHAEKIKTDTFKYYKTAIKAKCWVTNSGIERGLAFKAKNTFYFNTWHGTPIKKMGTDISKENKSFRKKGRSTVDIMTAQSDFEADVFSRVFKIPKEKFLLCGLPRNDKLAHYSEEEKLAIKNKLNLPQDKKVILYAPTFREYERDAEKNCVLKPPMNLEYWEKELGDDYCLLFRAHYEVGKIMNIVDNDFVKNMTDYPSLEELMIASDILISDYSSIIFDFSVMDKLVYLFTYDYDKYSEHRGMYFDIRDNFSGADNEKELISLLKNSEYDKEKEKTENFRKEYLNYFGNATGQSLDCIFNNINIS